MWDTKIGKSITRHFNVHEDDHTVLLDCRRCDEAILLPPRVALIYVLGEAVHHLQSHHALPGNLRGWQGYLDALPDP